MTMLMHHMLRAAAGAGAAPPVATDPQFNYVSLLLNDTGTNGQQNNTFLDSSSNNFTITRNGTPTQGSVTPYWPDGQWSNYFSGTGQYLSVPTGTAFQFGTGDFTVEAWINLSALGSDRSVIDFRSGVNTFGACYISGSGNRVSFYDGTVTSTGTSLTAGSWNHVAWVRIGTTLYGYLNGVQQWSRALSTNITTTGNPKIGSDYNGSLSLMNGFISNLRIVKGTALYTSNFTPSTTPLTAVSGTSLLTCQSNRFKDNSSNNFAITVTGTPTVQAFEPFEPASSYATSVGGSGYFSGSTQYISTAANAAYAFGTGDFTIEYWVYETSWSVSPTIVDTRTVNTSTTGYADYYSTAGKFNLYWGTTTVYTSNATVTLNAWNHVAVSRSGSTVRVFVNGALDGTFTSSFNFTDNSCRIGANVNATPACMTGYLSSVRMVKGTAVYTSAFTPPTSPVAAITGTSLLLNFTNAGIYDAATLNDLVTVGDAQVSTAQAKFGSSSMAFDGTGDWLTFPDSPVMQLGTGNFTIEGWLYLPFLGTARGIVSKGTSTTGWSVGVNLLNQFTFAYTTSTLTAATALTMGQWVHFAVVRNGSATGNVKIYFNGVLDATSGGAINDNFNQTSIGYVGADRVGTSPMNGYIEDLRITKGYARYTANFTPPTAPFPTR